MSVLQSRLEVAEQDMKNIGHYPVVADSKQQIGIGYTAAADTDLAAMLKSWQVDSWLPEERQEELVRAAGGLFGTLWSLAYVTRGLLYLSENVVQATVEHVQLAILYIGADMIFREGFGPSMLDMLRCDNFDRSTPTGGLLLMYKLVMRRQMFDGAVSYFRHPAVVAFLEKVQS